MADTGFVIAGTGSNNAGFGDTAWSDPDGIEADDDGATFASVFSMEVDETTQYLVTSAHGLSVPSGATIDGIEARVDMQSAMGTLDVERVRIVKDSSIGTTEGGSSETISGGSFANYDFGGATDLWGETWGASDVNASGFGVAVAFVATGGGGNEGAVVDAIWIKVYYTESTPSASGSLKAGAAAISGSALRTAKASGAIQAQLASLGGVGTGYQPQGVNFNGSTYLTRGADLTGNADGDQGIVSFWFRTSQESGIIYSNSTSRSIVQMTGGGDLQIIGRNSSDSVRLNALSDLGFADGNWHHFLAAWDISTANDDVYIYVDDVDALRSLSYFSGSTLDYTAPDHSIGGTEAGGTLFNGDLADVYVNFAEFLDISVTANRRKFVGAGAASSVDLGSDGSTPTGTAPIVYLHGMVGTWHTNDGTGGGFTENGALTDASSNPPAAPGPAIAVVTKKAQGTPKAQAAAVSGTASRTAKASGAPKAGSAGVTGAAVRTAKVFAGVIAAGVAKIVGVVLSNGGWNKQAPGTEEWIDQDRGGEPWTKQ